MAEFSVVHLKFVTPLHISRGDDDYDLSLRTIHSDTLASALYVMHRMVMGDDALKVEDFFKAVRLSTAFPYYSRSKEEGPGEEQIEYFFPKPFGTMFAASDDTADNKKRKKVEFISKSYFEKVIAGQEIAFNEKNLINNGRFLSAFSQEKGGTIQLFKSQTQTRVSLSTSQTEDAVPYDLDRIWFTPQAGFFVLFQAISPEIVSEEHLQELFVVLGQEGIGTDRNVGNGHFEVNTKAATKTFTIAEPSTPNCLMNLGLFSPSKEDIESIDIETSKYGLIERGGWIANSQFGQGNTLKKRSANFFSEMSIFSLHPDKAAYGQHVDLTPDAFKAHRILRHGAPLFVKTLLPTS